MPYNISQEHAGPPSVVRNRRLYLEILYVCKQLQAEGSEILQKNKSKFIKVTTRRSVAGWQDLRKMYEKKATIR